MQSAAIRKWLLALTLLAVILWAIVHFYNEDAQRSGSITRVILEPQGGFSYREPKTLASKTNKVSSAADAQKTLRQQVEEWLALHHRNASSLLAAFHVLDDTNFLREAATNFPDDPRVEWTILARNAFPADRRKWLDLFKASSPSNSLANYVSAQAYFQNGRSAAAVKDLWAAINAPDFEFENFNLESQLDTEELAQFCGETSLDAAKTAQASSSRDTAATLATLKHLASQMTDLQKQELNIGDNNSAENLAQMGTILGGQLSSGASGQSIENQLTGIAIQTMLIEQLDPNTSYDFLDGETASERSQELNQQVAELNQLAKHCRAIEPSLTDAEKASLLEREKIYGQIAALRWLVQERGNSQSGQ